MVNTVSAQVYEEIKAEGLVNRIELEEILALRESSAPMTAAEIGRSIGIEQRGTYQPRLTRLEGLGVVAKNAKRVCQVTGRSCNTYALTGRKPTAPVPVQGEMPLCPREPRPYDLSKKSERRRLLVESVGYIRTCRNCGTDFDGRRFAIQALEALVR